LGGGSDSGSVRRNGSGHLGCVLCMRVDVRVGIRTCGSVEKRRKERVWAKGGGGQKKVNERHGRPFIDVWRVRVNNTNGRHNFAPRREKNGKSWS
jgi:hypothetical protein